MNIENERAELIDDYISSHPSAKTDRKQPFEIAGKREDIPIYRLPLKYLYYNIRNGRFSAELLELEASEGRHLDPFKKKDALKIEDLLLEDKVKSEWLKTDLIRVGQLDPATITFDGSIINGNRRAAVLNRLFKDTGNDKYGYLEVVKLPYDVSPSDLWKFEAGFQLAVDLKVSYGPVNELLKIKEGMDYGLGEKVIAALIGGKNTTSDIKDKLEVLKLIDDYLRFFGQDKKYSIVNRRTEHFIDLLKIIKKKEWNKLTLEQQNQVLHAIYYYISDSSFAHLDIRKMGSKFLKDPKVAVEFANKALMISGLNKDKIEQSSGKQSILIPMEEEIENLESKLLAPTSPTNENPVDKPVEQPVEKPIEKPTKKPSERLTEIPPKNEQITLKQEDDPFNEQPNPALSTDKRAQLKELFESTVEKVDLVNQKDKPLRIIERIESNLQTLNEIQDEHLIIYKNDFARIEKLVKDLSIRFG